MACRAGLLLLGLLLAACRAESPPRYQGYVEGEYLRIAAPRAGRLDVLSVQRGHTVAAGQALFALDATVERAVLDEAQARLADLRKGLRPEELAVARAQLQQAQAQLALSESEWRRQRRLQAEGVSSRQRLEAAQSQRERDAARVRELQSRLQTGELAAREDQRKAAEAAVVQAQWALEQKSQRAPAPGLIDEVFYRPGEWVPAGSPVLSLLPPQNRRLRFFVPETVVGRLKIGQGLRARCDGCAGPLSARISHIAATAEFTPPVIYSREQRSRLVFLVEAQPQATDAAALHPGQPVDIELLP